MLYFYCYKTVFLSRLTSNKDQIYSLFNTDQYPFVDKINPELYFNFKLKTFLRYNGDTIDFISTKRNCIRQFLEISKKSKIRCTLIDFNSGKVIY